MKPYPAFHRLPSIEITGVRTPGAELKLEITLTPVSDELEEWDGDPIVIHATVVCRSFEQLGTHFDIPVAINEKSQGVGYVTLAPELIPGLKNDSVSVFLSMNGRHCGFFETHL